MVVEGDFKVELVHAETKQPFPEHYKDGQTYVEVEVGAEYYISYQRIGTSSINKNRFISNGYVDGKNLGWRSTYGSHDLDIAPRFGGSSTSTYEGQHRTQVKTALIFSSKGIGNQEVSPRQREPFTSPMMGKIEFKLSDTIGRRKRKLRNRRSEISELTEDEVYYGVTGDNSKKEVRSRLGKTSDATHTTITSTHKYKRGDLFQTITLNYCTVPGLISVGILPTGPAVASFTGTSGGDYQQNVDSKAMHYDLTKLDNVDQYGTISTTTGTGDSKPCGRGDSSKRQRRLADGGGGGGGGGGRTRESKPTQRPVCYDLTKADDSSHIHETKRQRQTIAGNKKTSLPTHYDLTKLKREDLKNTSNRAASTSADCAATPPPSPPQKKSSNIYLQKTCHRNVTK